MGNVCLPNSIWKEKDDMKTWPYKSFIPSYPVLTINQIIRGLRKTGLTNHFPHYSHSLIIPLSGIANDVTCATLPVFTKKKSDTHLLKTKKSSFVKCVDNFRIALTQISLGHNVHNSYFCVVSKHLLVSCRHLVCLCNLT